MPHYPILFLDIDGPLLPFGGPPGNDAPTGQDGTNPLVTRLDPALGPLLSALPCELVWATTWTHEANRVVGPLLGLPDLAVVEWPERADEQVDEWFGLHWKTRTVVEWAAGRPFIWVDDEIRDHDREWVSAQHGRSALLYRVDPRTGLRRKDFAVFTEWVNGGFRSQ
ncbi:HAD domain-containing protein [Nocardia sp. NPDC059246]|uniref:HAD domain-containing protein n=1 Tax=unclassified Nocardia TaxID=2637762 RepID=UPI003674E500